MPIDPYKMQPEELQALHEQADDVRLHDVKMGNMFHSIIHHLGRAFGPDVEAQSKPADAKASTKGQNNGN